MFGQARQEISCRLERLGDTSRPRKWERRSETPQPFRGVGYVKIKTALKGSLRWATKVAESPAGRPRASQRMVDVPDLLGERLLDALDDVEALEVLLKRVIAMLDPAGSRLNYVRETGARRSI